MNKSILITGANSGLGKESARQLALLNGTEKIILGVRSPEKGETAKRDLIESTGKEIFEVLIMDVSNEKSIKGAIAALKEPVDALIMNAGGVGGKDPTSLTSNGVSQMAAQNILGHAILVDELIKQDKLKKAVLFASSEAARGIEKMGMKRPSLETNSTDELASILDGSYFKNGFDAMQVYGHVKYVGTLWMSSMARKHPSIKFVSVSPGATSGTSFADNATGMMKYMFKYIMLPIVMPLRGMVHKVEKGASRYLDALENDTYKNGGFYASKETQVVGEMVDQFDIYPAMANASFQDNAYNALHRFI